MINKISIAAMSLFMLFAMSCSNDDSSDNITDIVIVQSFDIALDNANAIPMATGRVETGTIVMDLYNNNTLEFTITVNDLSSTDALTVAHVHTGDVVSTGGIAITLVDGTDISFSGNTASGIIALTTDEIATLLDDDVYVNVHSSDNPSGLLRGQIDEVVDAAYNITLSTDNEIPPVEGRDETGVAYIRIVGSTMHYRVLVNDLDSSDAITMGHIHEGDSDTNGPVLINLDITSNDDLDDSEDIDLTAEQLAKVTSDPLYVNIHSSQVPSGLVRGQIR